MKKRVEMIAKFHNEFEEFVGNGNPVDVMPWFRYLVSWRVNKFQQLLSKFYTIQDEQVHYHMQTFSRDVIRDVTDAMLATDTEDKPSNERFELPQSRLNNILVDLLGAGVNTTHRTLMWMLLYMLAYPDIQKRVQQEIDEVVPDRSVTLKDKKNLTFTEAVYLEVNRIVSHLPFSVPHYTIMDAKIGEFDIDKGTVVILNLHSVHHDKKYWGNPEISRPDRFLSNDLELDQNKCAHVIPFGMGRRRCVGETMAKMNIFLSFAIIMQRLEFLKPPGEQLDLTPIPGLIYRPRDYRVLVKERM
ncbi:Cytochrome P450 1A1 [Mactra antiquata]